MRSLAWMLVMSLLCTQLAAWAEDGQGKTSANVSPKVQDGSATDAQARKKPRTDKQATAPKTAAKNVSDKKTSDKPSSAQQPRPRSADATVNNKPPAVTQLNLNLPSGHAAGQVLEEDTMPEQGQALPDLFAPRDGNGKVTVDGRFLVEEDLEIHPGSEGEGESQNSSNDSPKEKKSDEFKSYLDSVEGAEINIRYHID